MTARIERTGGHCRLVRGARSVSQMVILDPVAPGEPVRDAEAPR